MYVFLRSIFSAFSSVFIFFACSYLHSGDTASLFNISIIIIALILSSFILKKIPSKIILYITIPSTIAGVILITQPSFIFTSGKPVSWAGCLFICAAGILRSACSFLKNHKIRDVEWYCILPMSSFFTSILASILMIISYTTNNFNWKSYYNTNNAQLFQFILYTQCLRSFILRLCRMFSFQKK